jgi:inositol 1,4,5-triphosphate receptor type 1
MTANE